MKVFLFSQPQKAASFVRKAIENQPNLNQIDKSFCERVYDTVSAANAASGFHYVQIGVASQSAIDLMIGALNQASVPANVVQAREGDELQVLF